MAASTITATNAGLTWRFANAAHKAAFEKEPAKYLPQYGGFCAMGAHMGKKFDGDPKAWHIADGKLYLNLNADVQAAWLKDVPGHNQSADAKWPGIALKTPKSL